MKKSVSAPTAVTRHLVPEPDRLTLTADRFGPHFPLKLEPTIYAITEHIAPAYCGGFWRYWRRQLSEWEVINAATDSEDLDSVLRLPTIPTKPLARHR